MGAQDAQARLLIVAAIQDLLTGPARAMGVSLDQLEGHVKAVDGAAGDLARAYQLLDALGGPLTASTADMGQTMSSLAGSVRGANQALDAFGDYEALIAAEAEGGVRSVREFIGTLEVLRAEVARIKAQGPVTFKIGAATAGTADEQLARQFAAAKTIFGRDLAAEARALQERIAAEQILDPLLRKRLQAEADLDAEIRQATVAEREQVEAFVRGEREIAQAIRDATRAEEEQVATFVKGAQAKAALLGRFQATLRAGEDERRSAAIAEMEATATNAFAAAVQRGAVAEEQFRKAITDATAAETMQLERTSELARMLRGGAWQAAIDDTIRLDAATRELGAEYVKAAQNAQRFFDTQRARGVAPAIASSQAQGRFQSDLAVFRAVSNPNTTGFQRFRVELSQGAISVREFLSSSKLLSSQFERFNQVAGSTASTLILFFVVLNRIREATNQAIEFSRAMTQVATITDLTGREVAHLGEQVQDLALSFGLKELDVARGLYFTLSSGIEDTADALELVTAANELAVTGFATVEQTIDLLTSTINAYGLSVSDARRLNDLFFQTVRVGKAELPELAHNLGSVLPIAAQMGVSLDELTGAIAALTLGGQNADESVTSLRQLFINFLNPTTDAQQILSELQTQTDKLGDSTLAAAIKSKGMLTVMQGLAETVGANAAKFRELVPDARGFVAVSALAGNQLGVFQRTLNATTNAAGANTAALQKVFTSQAKQIEIVQAGIRQGFLDIGQSIIDGFAPLDGTADGARAAAETIRDAIGSIGPAVQESLGLLKVFGTGLAAIRASVLAWRADFDVAFTDIYNGSQDAMSEWRKLGEADRARIDLDALIGGADDWKKHASAIADARSSVTSFAEAQVRNVDNLAKWETRLKSLTANIRQFADANGRNAALDISQDKRVQEARDAIAKVNAVIEANKVNVEYWLGLSGGGTFDQAIERARQSLANFKTRLMRERNISLGAPQSEDDANAEAAALAAAEFDRLATAAQGVETILRDIKNVNIREEFKATARVAEAFGSTTEEALVTAQEKVRALVREFRTAQFEILAKLNKGEFGPSTSDAASLEAGKQLNARRKLFEAQTEAAVDELKTAARTIETQKAIEAAYTNTNDAIRMIADSASAGDLAMAGLTAAFVAATRNAPDFAEAVRSAEYLKDITGKLKLSKLQEAEAEVAAVVAIRRRFEADVDANKITGEREQKIRDLIERLYAQAAAERDLLLAQAEKRTPTEFPFLSSIVTAAQESALAMRGFLEAGGAEKALKADLELLDQRRVTTLTQEAEALRVRLSEIEASIPLYESVKSINAADAEQMREKIALIRETTLAEMERNAAIEERERFLKTQGFGGGFAQAFDEMTQTIDESFERGKIIGDSFFSNLENGFASIVSGATSAKEAFQQFAQALLADISRLLVRMLLMQTLGKALGGLLNFGGGAATGDAGAGSVFPGSTPSAKGNVFEFGNIRQFKKGGFPDIGDEPALFRTRDGRLNSMREGGKPEAIVPLERGPGGELGVSAFGLPREPVVQDINVTTRPDTASFAAQAKALFASQRAFEREIDRIGASVRPEGRRAFDLPARPVPVEFSGRGAVGSARGGQTVNLRFEAHFQSLDPSRAADVVLTAMPQIQRAFTNVLRRGSDAELNAEIRTVAGVQ